MKDKHDDAATKSLQIAEKDSNLLRKRSPLPKKGWTLLKKKSKLLNKHISSSFVRESEQDYFIRITSAVAAAQAALTAALNSVAAAQASVTAATQDSLLGIKQQAEGINVVVI
jgi:hypothetical protein